MVEMQSKVAASTDCILDGRDIGTYVLPDCKHKFYVTASPEVRAKRRYDELIAKGQTVDYDNILKEINQRDYNDSHRDFAPLRQAEDAIFLETSDMTAEEVVDYIIAKVKNKSI